jgi:hypothetical protein
MPAAVFPVAASVSEWWPTIHDVADWGHAFAGLKRGYLLTLATKVAAAPRRFFFARRSRRAVLRTRPRSQVSPTTERGRIAAGDRPLLLLTFEKQREAIQL